MNSFVTAEFKIERSHLLNPDGSHNEPLPEFCHDRTLMLQLYRSLMLTRTFDQKAVNLQRTGLMGTYASSLGQEAIGVALGACMQPQDALFPAYREYGAMLQRGVQMHEILMYWGGDERGSHYANQPHDFPICVPIATQNLHAAGAAKAFQLRREPRVAVSVCGDGATSKGDFYEALNLAGTWKLPALFVVNNNQWAISVPLTSQTACSTIAQKAIAGNVPSLQVDGNDILALYQCFQTALQRIREGKGPFMIEAITYRLCDHTTADDAQRYRGTDALPDAWEKEPVKRFKAFLTHTHGWTEEEETALLTACQQEVEAAVQRYLSTPAPHPADAFKHLYADIPAPLYDQYIELESLSQGNAHA